MRQREKKARHLHAAAAAADKDSVPGHTDREAAGRTDPVAAVRIAAVAQGNCCSPVGAVVAEGHRRRNSRSCSCRDRYARGMR